MKLLLTSGGVSNTSIHESLVDLLGKPVAESSALFIPTAAYPLPNGFDVVRRMICGVVPTPLCELGWRSLGLLELTALPSLPGDLWKPIVRETDALLVGGGDPLYLIHWMHRSGLMDLLRSLPPELVYVGVSAGSLVMGPDVGDAFVDWQPPTPGDRGLGLVDFSMFPHLDHELLPENTMADAERWAATIPVPGYAIDDQSAIQVTDGSVEVISEGKWRLFTH